jgi:hypothetical protein
MSLMFHPVHLASRRGPRARPTIRMLSALISSFVLSLVSQPGTARAQTLRGSPASVERAHDAARARGLTFHRTRREAERAARAGTFVRLSNSANYQLRGVQLPYVLPATRAVVVTLAARYRRACGERMVVTSAIRPTSVRLLNSTAKTVHPTGMAVDLRRPGGRCRTWLRTELLSMERAGTIDATEERFPAHFHLVVYRAPSTATSGARRDAGSGP